MLLQPVSKLDSSVRFRKTIRKNRVGYLVPHTLAYTNVGASVACQKFAMT